MSPRELQQLQKEVVVQKSISYQSLFESITYLNQFITQKDKELLQHLVQFKINVFEDSDNIELEFEFKENKFIEQGIYKIMYVIDENSSFQDGLIEIKADQLDWKPEQNFLLKKSTKNKVKRSPSFFWIFKSFKAEDFENEQEEVIEYEMEQTSDISLFTISKEIGTLFKQDFYPYSMAAFFGY